MKWLLVLIFSMYSLAWGQSAAEALRITSNSSNFYEVLDISPNSTDKEIKTAYRRLMSVYHPDRHQGNPANLKAATQVMTKLNTVRETLLDPLKRKSYDITVKATAFVKPATASATSAKAPPGWEKHTYQDFSKTKKPAPEQAKAQPKAEPKPEPAKEAKRPAQPAPQPAEGSVRKETIKTADQEVRVSNNKADVSKMGPTSLNAKKAQKMYSENSKCGVNYFEHFIDIIQ